MIRKIVWMAAGLVMGISLSMSGGVLAQDMPACEGEYLESVRELGTTYIRALNEGNLDRWYAVLADGYTAHYGDSGFTEMDRDTARANDEQLFVAFPGFQTEIHFSTVSADCRFVTFHWTSSGVFSGTGQSGAVSGLSVAEVADGKILNEWTAYDLLTLYNAVGIMGPNAPAPGGLTDAVAADFVTRFDVIFNESLDAADELFAPEFVSHLPLAPQLDLVGWKNYVALFQASFPDIKQTTHFSFHAGDMLVVHVTYDGSFTGGPFFGTEPTGGPVSMNGIGIFKFVDGKAVENFAVVDVAGVLAQIGVWPPTPAQ